MLLLSVPVLAYEGLMVLLCISTFKCQNWNQTLFPHITGIQGTDGSFIVAIKYCTHILVSRNHLHAKEEFQMLLLSAPVLAYEGLMVLLNISTFKCQNWNQTYICYADDLWIFCYRN